MNNNSPTAYILIGVPASGKSTWLANQNIDLSKSAIISTDNILEEIAQKSNLTYDQVFKDNIDAATKTMNISLKQSINQEKNIYWDQTNTGVKNRAGKISKIPTNYRKVAVFFQTPEPEEHAHRLASRCGKTIPPHIIRSMMENLQPPTLAEGFDEIVLVGDFINP